MFAMVTRHSRSGSWCRDATQRCAGRGSVDHDLPRECDLPGNDSNLDGDSGLGEASIFQDEVSRPVSENSDPEVRSSNPVTRGICCGWPHGSPRPTFGDEFASTSSRYSVGLDGRDPHLAERACHVRRTVLGCDTHAAFVVERLLGWEAGSNRGRRVVARKLLGPATLVRPVLSKSELPGGNRRQPRSKL